MKKAITIIIFLISAICSHAQVFNKTVDSILADLNKSGTLTAHTPGSYAGMSTAVLNDNRPQFENKTDTVKAILLVCDLNTGSVSSMGYLNPLTQAKNDNRVPFWVIGYAIRKILSYDGSAVYGYSDGYLDEYKKPFPKNIIVWQSKNL